ncbi:ATP-binding cassette domain-containing protein [Spiribacter sp. C176]|uniref:ATP-binding cassette domain-containing protein n=1 Tax=Spiribacter salilacus TaxID=2664894 RepID=A0A6N7QP87_9GAMM|nr:ATP-binding cassette domain-containing protein [Spiribacter salilacus]
MGVPQKTLPIVFEGVTFAPSGVSLLGPLDFQLNAGQRTVIVGPNGAGKSLLLRLCHGLLKPTAGQIRCGDGAEAKSPEYTAVRQRQAMVFQRPILLRRSVWANALYSLKLRGIPKDQARVETTAALSLFGLEALAKRSARHLSGGEQQRLALARAWVLKPEVLFLDEPTSALDPDATVAVEAAIDQFHANGSKVVMVTHSVSQARRMADECLLLERGQIVKKGPVAEVL